MSRWTLGPVGSRPRIRWVRIGSKQLGPDSTHWGSFFDATNAGCTDPTTAFTGNAVIRFDNIGGNSTTVYQGLSCELAPGSWVSGVDAFQS
jgi:hypothetical protein